MDEQNQPQNLLAASGPALKLVLSILEERTKAAGRERQVQEDLRQTEEDLTTEENALRDEIESAVKQRREEIAASFDKVIRKDQDKLRKIKSKRDKAKSKGIEGRIEIETKPIRDEMKQTQSEIHALVKTAHLPKLCRYRLYDWLFCPRGIEHIGLILVSALWLLALPYTAFLLLPWKTPLAMLALCYAAGLLFFYGYRILNNHTRAAKWQEIQTLRTLRDGLAANRREIRSIQNSVKKDENEQGYQLESYDNDIRLLDEEIKTTFAEKQDALEVFEETTRQAIIEEVRLRFHTRLENLREAKKQAAADLKEAEQAAKNINKYITVNYESFLGREYTNPETIQEIIALMEEHNLQTAAEGLALYKSKH
jgi:hypothetical protein